MKNALFLAVFSLSVFAVSAHAADKIAEKADQTDNYDIQIKGEDAGRLREALRDFGLDTDGTMNNAITLKGLKCKSDSLAQAVSCLVDPTTKFKSFAADNHEANARGVALVRVLTDIFSQYRSYPDSDKLSIADFIIHQNPMETTVDLEELRCEANGIVASPICYVRADLPNGAKADTRGYPCDK